MFVVFIKPEKAPDDLKESQKCLRSFHLSGASSFTKGKNTRRKSTFFFCKLWTRRSSMFQKSKEQPNGTFHNLFTVTKIQNEVAHTAPFHTTVCDNAEDSALG